MTPEEIERMLTKLECPYCSTKDFELKLRCDLGFDRCLQTVRCRHCDHEFDAEVLIKSQGFLVD